ncbi:MAG: BatD family protein [Planctomycetes bacterium]|nr:BatD family protein [Planctomycetota bacterium]
MLGRLEQITPRGAYRKSGVVGVGLLLSMLRTGRTSAAMICALAFFAVRAAAQPSVELRIDANEAYADEATPLTLWILNYRQAGKPVLPAIPGCEFGGGSQETSMFSDGRQTRTTMRIHYELVAHKPGDLVIPPIEVDVDGRTLKTEPVKLTILPSQVADLLQAEITTDQKQLFVGQQVLLKLSVYLRPAIVNRQTIDRQSMKRFLKPTWGELNEFRETGKSGTQRRRDASGDAKDFYVFEYTLKMTLDRPGPLELGELAIPVDYPISFGRDMFGEIFVEKYRRLRTQPQRLLPDVQPLPTANRPAGFTGAIGNYRIDVSARPLRVRVGDPINLTLALSGQGDLESLPPPNLAVQPGLTEKFRVPEESLAGRMENGRRIFTQTIRARTSDVREIPPIEYAFFDVERSDYAVARSAPLAITVEASNHLDASTLPEFATPSRQEPAAPEVVDGLLGNRVESESLLRAVRPVRISDVALVMIMPPAAFIAACAWSTVSQRRTTGSRQRRRQEARAIALARIETAQVQPAAQQTSAIAAAVAGYLADRLDLPPGRCAGEDGVATLQQSGADEAAVGSLREFVARCDRAAYAGGDDDQDLADLARRCIDELARGET